MKRIFQHFQYFIWLSWFWWTGTCLSASNGTFRAYLIEKICGSGWDSNLKLIAPIVLGKPSCASFRLTLKGYARLVHHTLVITLFKTGRKGNHRSFIFLNLFSLLIASGTFFFPRFFVATFASSWCRVRCDFHLFTWVVFAGTSRKCWHHEAVQTWRSQD